MYTQKNLPINILWKIHYTITIASSHVPLHTICTYERHCITVRISSPSLAGHNGDCYIGSSPDLESLLPHTFPKFSFQWHKHGVAPHYSGGTALDYNQTSLLSPKRHLHLQYEIFVFHSTITV
jgi:hypothetical protein